ncbi:hypothetical protein EOE18_15350 [Novosphingobium umbonatum]|uniref:Uncharacterized protein n=1 Tax=Novosphingobium umbonatum TaxID=1908524 RepID=A0A3S2UPE6_9SPHN|nr:hypothetical protein [Novosphingobium umbonatum]RVU03497.1 hypothetical protein EOE18_15350 [Novosphingobium umbonatum]
MTGRASESLLDALHGMLAGALTDELKRAMEAVDSDGVPVPINPQLLDKVMKFLAQNGVDAPKSAPRVDTLAAQLAEVNLDDVALGRPN